MGGSGFFFSWKFVAKSRASLCCMLSNAFDLVAASVSHRYVKSSYGSRFSCTAVQVERRTIPPDLLGPISGLP